MELQIWVNPGLDFPRVGDQIVPQVVPEDPELPCIMSIIHRLRKEWCSVEKKILILTFIVTIVYKSKGKLPVYSLTRESKGSIN